MRFMNQTKTGGHALWGLVCWAVGNNYIGSWWIGLGRSRLILKAPWNGPLFSERYGLTKTFKIGGGWRLQFRRVPANQ